MSAILICFQHKSEARLLALARGDLGAESEEERTTEGMRWKHRQISTAVSLSWDPKVYDILWLFNVASFATLFSLVPSPGTKKEH